MTLQEIGELLGVEPINGNWLQAISTYLGIEEPVNSNWLQSIAIGTLLQKYKTGWERNIDTTNIQALTGSIDNLISFNGNNLSNDNLNLLDNNSKITPILLGDLLIIDFAFTVITPNLNNQYVNVKLKVNGNIYRSQTFPLLKYNGLDEYVSVSFSLPVENIFLTNGAVFYIEPSTNMSIKNRYISVLRSHMAIL